MALMWFGKNDTRSTRRWLAAGGLTAALALPAWAQQAEAPAAPASAASAAQPEAAGAKGQAAEAPPAFSIEVKAPDGVRELVEKYNELQRYQAVPDLESSELDRLLVVGERDVRNLLGTQGFFSPTIHVTRAAGDDGRPKVVIEVDPGEPTVVKQVEIGFEGDIQQSTDDDAARQRRRIVNRWGLPEGKPFTQDGWSSAKTDALRTLLARRYPAGKISYSLADIDAPANAARLHLRLDSGPVFKLGELQVSGVQRYDPVLVPRLSRLKAGQVYDQQSLNDAQARLTASGYYDSAYIFVDPESKTPEAVPVQVQVSEAKLQKLTLGVGYSTDGGPRLSAEYTHNRVPGIGWRAITKLQLEKKDSYLQTDWHGLPAENGWRLGTFAKFQRLDDGELVTTSQQLRYGRSKSDERYDRNYYLQFDRAAVSHKDGMAISDARAGDGTAISVNYAWTGRYFNNLQYPTRGYGLGAELGAGYTLEGVRKPFVRATARWLQYVPLGRGAGGSRLALRAEGGAVITNEAARVPGNLLFRTGGNTTVRGYAYRAIGIDYDDGTVVGPGRYMAVGSIEWQRPIMIDGERSIFEHIVFLDAGDVAQKAVNLRPRFGVGTGVRVRTPVGPLELDLAYGLKSRQFRLHLNVGFVW